jgi:hypothetical protein
MTRFDKLFFIGLAVVVAVLVAVALYASGCGTARAVAPSWSDQRCQTLMDQRDASVWGAAMAGGLAGVGGLSAAFPGDDQKKARIGLGISSAVVAAVATSLTMLAKMKSGEFELYCGATAPIDPAAPPAPVDDILAPMPVEWVEYDDEDGHADPDGGIE